jgi:hypothetical protein
VQEWLVYLILNPLGAGMVGLFDLESTRAGMIGPFKFDSSMSPE